MHIKEMQQLLENESDGNELYDLLIDCGKKYPWTPQEKNQLKNIIVKICDDPSEQARSASIRVLCFYWGMEEFRDKAWEMFSYDKNDDVRSDALISWANTYRKQNKASVMKTLYSILENKNTEVTIRETAYRCIFYVSPLPPENRPNQILDWDHFDENVDWKLIEKLISEAQ